MIRISSHTTQQQVTQLAYGRAMWYNDGTNSVCPENVSPLPGPVRDLTERPKTMFSIPSRPKLGNPSHFPTHHTSLRITSQREEVIP